MDFEFSDEQKALRESITEFGKSLNDRLIQRDENSEFDRDVWRRCGEFGVPGLPVPEDYGGLGQDFLTTLLAMEAFGYACRDNGLVFSQNAQMWAFELPLVTFGTHEQKERYLPPLCRGEFVAAHAISEPQAGSDITSMTTRYRRDGNDYILNGTKTFATNAPVADEVLAFATLNPGFRAAGMSGFLIERDMPGVSFSRPVKKMGLRSSPMGEVVFSDCRVPKANLLGREGQGFAIFSCAMEWERACIFASHLGSMERLLEDTIAYAKTRKQFGEPISRFQSIADKIVDMKVSIEAGRLLLYKVAATKDSGKDAMLEASIAKLFVSEAHVRQALDAIQIHGGYGYCTEYEVERELRDAIGGTIYSGTSQIQRKLIADFLGL
jgi:alkylation response protein AidB-like acyl-CoA dehydrogenase